MPLFLRREPLSPVEELKERTQSFLLTFLFQEEEGGVFMKENIYARISNVADGLEIVFGVVGTEYSQSVFVEGEAVDLDQSLYEKLDIVECQARGRSCEVSRALNVRVIVESVLKLVQVVL